MQSKERVQRRKKKLEFPASYYQSSLVNVAHLNDASLVAFIFSFFPFFFYEESHYPTFLSYSIIISSCGILDEISYEIHTSKRDNGELTLSITRATFASISNKIIQLELSFSFCAIFTKIPTNDSLPLRF